MYGQVVDDPNRGALQNLLAQWMQNSEQRRRDASAQAAEDQRFQQTMGLKREELDAQKGLWGAQTNKENYMVSSGRAQRIAASLKSNYDHLIAAGLPDQAAAYVRGVTKRYEKDPEIMNEVAGWVNERPMTDSDIAAQNTAFYSAQETGKAASGSPDVQARAFTQESALGRPMSGHQFADQAQRQPEAANTKTPYGQTLNIQGGRTPSATAKLQAQTQIATQAMQESGATKRTQMQIDAAQARGVSASGAPGKASPGISAAGEDVLRGGDIGRIPPHARMAVFEYVAAKGGKALPKDVQTKIRDQISAETALDGISAAFEDYAKAKTPGEVAKSGVNLRAKVNGAVPLLARGIGHTGVLTQQDVDSVVVSLLGAGGLSGLAMTKALPGETRQRIGGMKEQFAEIQRRLLQDLIPAGSGGGNIIATPDGLKWQQNPDGSMTQVP